MRCHPPSPGKATHCPHPTEGTRVGCRDTLEVIQQGGRHLPPRQAADLGLHCLPCSVGKKIRKGPWVMWGYPRVVPTPSVGAGGGFSQVGSCLHPVPALHLSNTHSSGLRERWAGSGSQKAAGPWWSQRPPHPSSLSASAGSPAVLGSGAERTAGRSRAARDRQEASWR